MKTKRFIPTGNRTKCCGATEILVNSKTGRYITRNCIKCNKYHQVKISDLQQIADLQLECEKCSGQLIADRGVPSGYQYRCKKCKAIFDLPVMPPLWTDLTLTKRY